jgi:alpha-beta hydrolase superfamily lysophospholipase
LADGAAWTLETHTAGDGYAWHYLRYLPAGPPRARVVFVHGIQSHAGWYEGSCTWLQRAGFAVYFLDRRGSGQNQAERGDTPGFRRLLDDVAEFLSFLREDRQLPLFLAGISWGGKVVLATHLRHPGLIDGLALICPGFFPQVRVPLRQRLKIAWARLVRPTRRFPVPLSDPELFTATPHWQDFIRKDPLALREATSRFFIESIRLDGYLRLAGKRVGVPVLLLLAECDRIIQNERTRRFVEKLEAPHRQVIEYAGAHHTLEFEPEPQRFYADLQRWFEQQGGRGAEPALVSPKS